MNDSSNGRVKGQVASILNERELAINRGSSHGVKTGMLFAVMATESPIEILDPETGEPIGREYQEKVRVVVTRAEDKHSVCETESYMTRGGPFYNLGSNLWSESLFEKPQRVQRSLRASQSEFPEPLPPEESYVRVGDPVHEVPEAD